MPMTWTDALFLPHHEHHHRSSTRPIYYSESSDSGSGRDSPECLSPEDSSDDVAPNPEWPVPDKHQEWVRLAVKGRMGTVVALDRGPSPRLALEYMPLALRLGMKLVWAGRVQNRLLKTKEIEAILRKETIREGRRWDSMKEPLKHILAFMKSYRIDPSELLIPNPALYASFNEFFYRKLKPNARPQDSPGDSTVITSAADCRLTVFDSVQSAKRFWIKGSQFSLGTLLENDGLAHDLEGGSLAIFRLAPADYHRFHSPVNAIVGPVARIPGQYYTVNPQAVNENLDVFTKNRRDVMTLLVPRAGTHLRAAFVMVGAMLVGSITETAQKGEVVVRGDELGYFAYGGSTCILVLPPGVIQWDEDLLRNSAIQMETKVKVGEHIGRFLGGEQ